MSISSLFLTNNPTQQYDLACHSLTCEDVISLTAVKTDELKLVDLGTPAHTVSLVSDSTTTLSADRTLTLDVKNNSRALTLSSDLTVAGTAPVSLSSDSGAAAVVTFPHGTHTSCTLDSSQTLTNKTLDDSLTTYTDHSTLSKFGKFDLSEVTPGTVTVTWPTANTHMASTDTQQTLTNKTLQAPWFTTLTKPIAISGNIAASDTGATFLVTNSGTTITMTLPLPAAGLHYRFIIVAPAANTMNIVTNGGTHVVYGTLLGDVGAGVIGTIPLSGVSGVTWSSGLQAIGDQIEMMSDGTSWFVLNCSWSTGGAVNDIP